MFIQRFLKSSHSWTLLSELMKIPWGVPPRSIHPFLLCNQAPAGQA